MLNLGHCFVDNWFKVGFGLGMDSSKEAGNAKNKTDFLHYIIDFQVI